MYNINPEYLSTRYKGEKSELKASFYLASLGYRIMLCNFSALGRAEIDILSYDNGTLVVVEVKSNLTKNSENIDLSKWVDLRKRNKIKRATDYFLSKNVIPFSHLRFDVIYISKNKITHYRGVPLY